MYQINGKPIAALIMGSQSDWETMKFSEQTLNQLKFHLLPKLYLPIELLIECMILQNKLKTLLSK